MKLPADVKAKFAAFGKKGGKIGGKATGEKKARTSEQARAAVRARWDKAKKAKAA